jgi:hypothetical protein
MIPVGAVGDHVPFAGPPDRRFTSLSGIVRRTSKPSHAVFEVISDWHSNGWTTELQDNHEKVGICLLQRGSV